MAQTNVYPRRGLQGTRIYTGRVVRLRSSAFVLALLLAATPVLGVICELDCDPPAAASECHEPTTSKGPTVRGAQHCDHLHTTGSPALLSKPSARDSVFTFAAAPVAALSHSLVSAARSTMTVRRGPPGLSGRSRTSLSSTVLRI